MITRRYNTRSSSSSSSKSRKLEENPSDQSIPLDLVIEIFTRLPIKSLARFRCLSKQYASTFCTPIFTDSFFTISSSRPKLLFNVYKGRKTFFFSSPQPQNPSHPVTLDFHKSFSSNCPSGTFRPVNGLVCGLNKRKGRKVLPLICNPSTGQFLNLPRVETRRTSVISFLGYDPIEKQFKVLCMTKPSLYSFSEEHQVLTIETGEKKPSWRMIKCDIPHSPIYVDYRDGQCVYDGICINGVFYYLALIDNKRGFPNIVCFDIRSEKFSFIKRAHAGMDIFNTGGRIRSTLLNYKGKLATLMPNIDFNQHPQKYTGIKLWVLEDAEKHEWSSHIYVLPHPWKDIVAKTKLCFVGTTSRGEIVLSPNNISDSFYLLYYNPETNSITKVGIQRMEAFQPHQVFNLIKFTPFSTM